MNVGSLPVTGASSIALYVNRRCIYLNDCNLLIVRAVFSSGHVSVVGTQVVGILLALLIRATTVDQGCFLSHKAPAVLSICILCTCGAG